ncbi:MAG: GNAT family N-acetyltransferase [Planctomycetota bacterium]|jgi:GNAT superfamily N-acetyltransferase
MTEDLEFRIASQKDVAWLPEMNQQLILDEKHRNEMTLKELEQRMSGFLHGRYQAVIVRVHGEDVGYGLYIKEEDCFYIRQVYVRKEMRRQGVGRSIVNWIRNNPAQGFKIIRTSVLVWNLDGIEFWKTIGFKDYVTTMELINQ